MYCWLNTSSEDIDCLYFSKWPQKVHFDSQSQAFLRPGGDHEQTPILPTLTLYPSLGTDAYFFDYC